MECYMEFTSSKLMRLHILDMISSVKRLKYSLNGLKHWHKTRELSSLKAGVFCAHIANR